MKKQFLIKILVFLSLTSTSQNSYFSALFDFPSPNYNNSKVIVDDKIYILNTDSDAYIINKLRLDGTVISSLKYYVGKYPENNYYTKLDLFLVNDKLLSVFFYDNSSTMILVTDTSTGNISYSNKYDFYYQSSELLDNGNLVINSGGLVTNIDALNGNVISSFSYPNSFTNNGLRISSMSKNNGSSYIMTGVMYFNPSKTSAFVVKINNNQTMSNTGFHQFPAGFAASNSYCKGGDLYCAFSKNNGWNSYNLKTVLKSDTTFTGVLKNYQGITVLNSLQNSSTGGSQTMFATNNNVLLSSTPNNLTGYSYIDLMHNQEIISFDRNLNYIKAIQYPSYCYTVEPMPEIDYYKGCLYTSLATSSYLPNTPVSPKYFNYYWLYKSDSIGETSCTSLLPHSSLTFSFTDSIITSFLFTPSIPTVTNIAVTFSNTIVTSTIMCSTVTDLYKIKTLGEFVAYPNPTSEKLNIKLVMLNDLENLSIKLYDVLGKVLLKENYKSEITISQLAKGVYFLSLYKNNQLIETKKIIKE